MNQVIYVIEDNNNKIIAMSSNLNDLEETLHKFKIKEALWGTKDKLNMDEFCKRYDSIQLSIKKKELVDPVLPK